MLDETPSEDKDMVICEQDSEGFDVLIETREATKTTIKYWPDDSQAIETVPPLQREFLLKVRSVFWKNLQTLCNNTETAGRARPEKISWRKLQKAAQKELQMQLLPIKSPCPLQTKGPSGVINAKRCRTIQSNRLSIVVKNDSVVGSDLEAGSIPFDFGCQTSNYRRIRHGIKQCFDTPNGSWVAYFETGEEGCGVGITVKPTLVTQKSILSARENVLGFRAYKDEEFKTARSHFENAITLFDNNDQARFNLICTLALLGEPLSKASSHISILLQPSNSQLKEYLEKLNTDNDLKVWRNDPAFKQLVNKI